LCKSRIGVHLEMFSVWETLFFRRYKFKKWVSATNFQEGQVYIITNLISALWRDSLMLVPKRSLSNTEYVIINILNALASIMFMYSLHVILL
jgi:hypothetical protein